VPHALHMPSHIFTRLGLWKESIESNLASAAASRDFELRTRMAGAWDQELHALDYLEYAYLQTGEDEKAKAIVERIREIHSVQPQSLSAAFALSAVPARYAVEGHRWKEAAALALAPADFPWKSFPIGQAMNGWARALGLIHTSDLSSARKETDALAALRDAVKTQPGYDWSSAIEVLRLSASGWLSHAEGRDADARTALQAAADLEDSIDKHAVSPGAILPAREQLADFLLEAEHPEEALREYQASSRSAPNRFAALWGGGRAAQEAGRPTQAKAFYERLLESADPGSARPELARAKAFISRSEGSSSR